MADFLALEGLLIARAQERVRYQERAIDVVSVREVQVDSQDEPVLRAPALMVSFDGYRVPESSGYKARVRQTWSIVVALANLRDRAGVGAREDASGLIDQVIAAFLGWVPPVQDGRAWKPLELTDPAYEVSYGRKLALFPLSFITERSVKGERAN